MKIAIIIIFATFMLLSNSVSSEPCDVRTAKQAIPPRIFYEQTIDGFEQPILTTRFFHNKIGIFGNEFAKCYLNFFDLNFIKNTVSLVGLPFWLYYVYTICVKKMWFPIGFLLILPILPFLDFPPILVSFPFKIFAIIGIAQALNKIKWTRKTHL